MALTYRGEKVGFFFNWNKDYANNLTDLANNLADNRDQLQPIAGQDARETFKVVANAYNIVLRLVQSPNRFSKEDQIMVFESLTDLYDVKISPNLNAGRILYHTIQSYIGLMIRFLAANFNTTGTVRMNRETLFKEMKAAGNCATYLEAKANFDQALAACRKERGLLEDSLAEYEDLLKRRDAHIERGEPVPVRLKDQIDDVKKTIRTQKNLFLNAQAVCDDAEKSLANVQKYSSESESIIRSLEVLSTNDVIDIGEFERLNEELKKEREKAEIIERTLDDISVLHTRSDESHGEDSDQSDIRFAQILNQFTN